MSEPTTSEVSAPRAPKPSPRFQTIVKAVPTIALAGGFWLMIFQPVPAANKDIVIAIVSGLLGYLTHAAQTRAPKSEA